MPLRNVYAWWQNLLNMKYRIYEYFMPEKSLQCRIFPELQLMAQRQLKTFGYKIHNFSFSLPAPVPVPGDLVGIESHTHTGCEREYCPKNGTSNYRRWAAYSVFPIYVVKLDFVCVCVHLYTRSSTMSTIKISLFALTHDSRTGFYLFISSFIPCANRAGMCDCVTASKYSIHNIH